MTNLAVRAVLLPLLLLISHPPMILGSDPSRQEFLRAIMAKTPQQQQQLLLTRHRRQQQEQQEASFSQRLLALARPVSRDLAQQNNGNNDDDQVQQQQNYYYNYDDDNYVPDYDLREYAFKYVGCQTIKTWSDYLAQDEDAETVLASKRFVVFRMCPADQCSNYNKFGCGYNYGEYMVEMDDYLVLMAEYHYAQYQEYCETCEACMNPQQYNNNNNDDDAVNYDDDANNNDDANARWLANDDDANNYNDDAVNNNNDDAVNNNAYSCQYAEACANYKDACSNYDTYATSSSYEDFFECTQFEVGNNVAYLGPHCNGDGHTMSIGIYDDEECSNYVGDVLDLESFTGMSFDDEALSFYYSKSCVSCLDKDAYVLYQEGDADQVYGFCDAVYDTSAKCNRYLAEGDRYESDNQEETETQVCDFIESLVENSYDEFGEIAIRSASFDFNNWKDIGEYTNYVRAVSLFQKAALVFSILLFVSLLLYSCYLYAYLTKHLRRGKWKQWSASDPNARAAGHLSRIDSGIMMGRSQSDRYSYDRGALA